MSFIGGRFDPEEIGEVDEEVRNLYRIRDNDRTLPEACLVDPKQFGNDEDTYLYNNLKPLSLKPNDSIWGKMTETERIENGLPTRFYLFATSLYGLSFISLMMGISVVCYGRIFYPGGIILRRQRKEGMVKYLTNRLPFCFLFGYCIYLMQGYGLNYVIDFYSDEEEALEKEFDNFKKH